MSRTMLAMNNGFRDYFKMRKFRIQARLQVAPDGRPISGLHRHRHQISHHQRQSSWRTIMMTANTACTAVIIITDEHSSTMYTSQPVVCCHVYVYMSSPRQPEPKKSPNGRCTPL
jgi:hypothetical protein